MPSLIFFLVSLLQQLNIWVIDSSSSNKFYIWHQPGSYQFFLFPDLHSQEKPLVISLHFSLLQSVSWLIWNCICCLTPKMTMVLYYIYDSQTFSFSFLLIIFCTLSFLNCLQSCCFNNPFVAYHNIFSQILLDTSTQSPKTMKRLPPSFLGRCNLPIQQIGWSTALSHGFLCLPVKLLNLLSLKVNWLP